LLSLLASFVHTTGLGRSEGQTSTALCGTESARGGVHAPACSLTESDALCALESLCSVSRRLLRHSLSIRLGVE
jgi:hypothetical protein